MQKFLKWDFALKGICKVFKGLFYLLGEIFWQIFISIKPLKWVLKVKYPLIQFRIRGPSGITSCRGPRIGRPITG
jgi:hypothetical protein